MDGHSQQPWHAQPLETVYAKLHTTAEGLSDAEANTRLKKKWTE